MSENTSSSTTSQPGHSPEAANAPKPDGSPSADGPNENPPSHPTHTQPTPVPTIPWRKRLLSVFVVSLVACSGLALWGVVDPDGLSGTARGLTEFSLTGFDWLFMGSCTCYVVICLVLAFSKYGSLKLGKDDEEPEFSTPSWLSMLFAAGMGSGLLFWGAAEPVTHLMHPPPEQQTRAEDPARWAMVITLFHWGLHPWGIYALGALVLAFFGFRQDRPLLPSAPLHATLPPKLGKTLGSVADVVAVLAVVFGVSGSIGMGVLQVSAGLNAVFGTPLDSPLLSIAILALVVASYLASASTSVDQGIELLSNLNMAAAILLMVYILFVGPTSFMLSTAITSVGDYLENLVGLSTRLFHYSGETEWSRVWTLTYLIWWIAWTPFVGIFIARISRGRTIREFVTGVMLLPTVFSVVWFGVFGGTGIYLQEFGGSGFGSLVSEDVSRALFSLFAYFPGSTFLSLLALFLIFIFLVTSADSASFVLGMMTSGGSLNPPTSRKLLWGLVIAALTVAGLFATSGEKAVRVMRAIAISGAIPFIFVMNINALCLLWHLTVRMPDEEADKTPPSSSPDSNGPTASTQLPSPNSGKPSEVTNAPSPGKEEPR